MAEPKKTSVTGLPEGFEDEIKGLLGGQKASTKKNPWDTWPSEEDWFGSQRWPAALPFDSNMTDYGSYQKQLKAIQGARAFAVGQFGREEQRLKNQDVDDRYAMRRQAAEGKYLQQREEETRRKIEEQQQVLVDHEKKKKALSGASDWMKYMTEIGEKPSWLGYWFDKKGV